MGRKAQVKATKSRDTIVLIYKKEVLNIQKAEKPEAFKQVAKLMKDKDMDGLIKKFIDIAEGVKEYSDGNFTVEGKKVFFKGDKTTPMPQTLVNKIVSHYNSGADYKPLIMFWKKCLQNPTVASREELFDFMEKNNIPLTDMGDIIVEKGVNRLEDGTLVDCHSRTVDNSIGMTVRMPLASVDPDRRNECSNGLHVGAPDYVRNHWSSDVVVTCIVSPEHVVSVPKDYNATKMRVCEYKVVGFADKTKIDPSKLVFNIEDIFDVEEAEKSIERKVERKPIEKRKTSARGAKKVTSKVDFSRAGLTALTAGAIKALILKKFKVQITIGDKSKKAIINKALKIVAENTTYKPKDFNGMTKQDIINKVIEDYGVELKDSLKKPFLIKEAIKVSKNKK